MYQPPMAGSECFPTVLTDVVERHAQEAASLWHLRASATRSPAYDLHALGRLDDRLEAHIDGLRIAGDVGREICTSALAFPGAGEVFVATVLAIEREDDRTLAEILARFGGLTELAQSIVSALGWIPFDHAKRLLNDMAAPDAPAALHYFAIAGCALHRHDPREPLAVAVKANDLRLRARALRACGELGRSDLLPALMGEIDADDDACRFWAAWSAALLGDPTVHDVLWSMACGESRFVETAADLMVRFADPEIARRRVYELIETAGQMRRALVAAGALGDPSILPWVMDCMAIDQHARLAGSVFGVITGVNLATLGLCTKTPAGFRAGPSDDPADLNVGCDPDASHPWPQVEALRAWWSKNGMRFSPGKRLLLGRPLDHEWLRQVLRSGAQPARAAAALESTRLRKRWPLFEIRAPTLRQQRMLSDPQWTTGNDGL